MKPADTIRALAAHAGMTMHEVSRSCGRSDSWAKGVAGRDGVALATVAAVADVAGCDVVIMDRETGERLGVVEPPER